MGLAARAHHVAVRELWQGQKPLPTSGTLADLHIFPLQDFRGRFIFEVKKNLTVGKSSLYGQLRA